jgi:uncharacterized protein DUF6378
MATTRAKVSAGTPAVRAGVRFAVHESPKLLEHAAGLVNRRRREYGEPIDLFEQVAPRWTLTLGSKVSPAQVVLCLIDLKLARLARDPKHLR